jgi:DNA-binding NarL/FixJ family response regulator
VIADDRPVRVVVADDEADVRLLLEIQLTADGFEVVGHAGDGRTAVDRCLQHDADAVVMDLLMPTVSGFEAIAELQARMPRIGIVAYTAVAGEFVRAEMERLGIELVLKSGDVSKLAAALRRAADRAPTF